MSAADEFRRRYNRRLGIVDGEDRKRGTAGDEFTRRFNERMGISQEEPETEIGKEVLKETQIPVDGAVTPAPKADESLLKKVKNFGDNWFKGVEEFGDQFWIGFYKSENETIKTLLNTYEKIKDVIPVEDKDKLDKFMSVSFPLFEAASKSRIHDNVERNLDEARKERGLPEDPTLSETAGEMIEVLVEFWLAGKVVRPLVHGGLPLIAEKILGKGSKGLKAVINALDKGKKVTDLSKAEIATRVATHAVEDAAIGAATAIVKGREDKEVAETATSFGLAFGATSVIPNPLGRGIVSGVTEFGVSKLFGEEDDVAASRAAIVGGLQLFGGVIEEASLATYKKQLEFVEKRLERENKIRSAIGKPEPIKEKAPPLPKPELDVAKEDLMTAVRERGRLRISQFEEEFRDSVARRRPALEPQTAIEEGLVGATRVEGALSRDLRRAEGIQISGVEEGAAATYRVLAEDIKNIMLDFKKRGKITSEISSKELTELTDKAIEKITNTVVKFGDEFLTQLPTETQRLFQIGDFAALPNQREVVKNVLQRARSSEKAARVEGAQADIFTSFSNYTKPVEVEAGKIQMQSIDKKALETMAKRFKKSNKNLSTKQIEDNLSRGESLRDVHYEWTREDNEFFEAFIDRFKKTDGSFTSFVEAMLGERTVSGKGRLGLANATKRVDTIARGMNIANARDFYEIVRQITPQIPQRFMVGLTNATLKSETMTKRLEQADALNAAGKFNDAQKIYDDILKEANKIVRDTLKGLEGVEFTISKQKGLFGRVKPAFVIDAVVPATKQEEFFLRMALLGESFRQDAVHVGRTLTDTPAGVNMGVRTPQGVIYQPEYKVSFQKALTPAEELSIIKAMDEKGILGATIAENKHSITLYNGSEGTKKAIEFIEATSELIEGLHSQGFRTKVTPTVRELRSYGRDTESGFTRTYGELRDSVPLEKPREREAVNILAELNSIKELDKYSGSPKAKRNIKLREQELKKSEKTKSNPPTYKYEHKKVDDFIVENASPGVRSSLKSPEVKGNIKIKTGNEKIDKLKESSRRTPVNVLAKTKNFMSGIIRSFKQFFQFKADVKKFPVYRNEARKFQDVPYDIMARNVEAIDAVIHQVKKDPVKYDLFNSLVVFSDFEARALKGKPLPLKLTLKEVQQELSRVHKAIIEGGHKEVLSSYKKAMELNRSILKDMQKEGKLLELDSETPYFHHIVLDYGNKLGEIYPWIPTRIKNAYKGYLKQAKGSELPIEYDYLTVQTDYMMRVGIDSSVDAFANRMAQMHDLLPNLTKKQKIQMFGLDAKGNVRTPSLRREYRFNEQDYVAYQPSPGNNFFQTETLDGRTIEQALKEGVTKAELIKLVEPRTGEAVKRFLAVGRKNRIHLIPKEIKEDLSNFRNPKSGSEFMRAISDATWMWKRITLDFAGVPFQFGNFFGDFVNLYREDIGAFTKIPDALSLMAKKDYGAAANEIVQLAIKERVLGRSTAFIAPVPGVKKPSKLNILNWIEEFSFRREGILRMAKFMKDVERVRAGKQVVAKTIPKNELAAIAKENPYAAAGKVSREIFVDYGNISDPFRRWASGLLFPFVTFYTQNAKNWGAYVKANPGEAALKFGVPLAATITWNNTGSRAEIEKNLPDYIKFQPHIITGFTSEDGRPIVLTMSTPLDLAAKTVGLDRFPENVRRLVDGQLTPIQFAFNQLKDSLLGTPRLAWRLFNPFVRTAVDLARNKDFIDRTIVPQNIEGTKEATYARVNFALQNVFTPYAQYLRSNRVIEDGAPTTEYIKNALLEPFGVDTDKGSAGFFKGLGVRVVDPQAVELSQNFEKRAELEAERTVFLNKIEDSYLKSLFDEEYSRVGFRDDFSELINDAHDQGIYISADDISGRIDAPSFGRKILQRSLKNEKDPELKRQIRETINVLLQQTLIDGSTKAIAPTLIEEVFKK